MQRLPLEPKSLDEALCAKASQSYLSCKKPGSAIDIVDEPQEQMNKIPLTARIFSLNSHLQPNIGTILSLYSYTRSQMLSRDHIELDREQEFGVYLVSKAISNPVESEREDS